MRRVSTIRHRSGRSRPPDLLRYVFGVAEELFPSPNFARAMKGAERHGGLGAVALTVMACGAATPRFWDMYQLEPGSLDLELSACL